MSNIVDNEKECDFQQCESQAYRHFWMHHFCNEHNWYLRNKAQRDNVQDLDEFINRHCGGSDASRIRNTENEFDN